VNVLATNKTKPLETTHFSRKTQFLRPPF
jgi:hypothetical protein